MCIKLLKLEIKHKIEYFNLDFNSKNYISFFKLIKINVNFYNA